MPLYSNQHYHFATRLYVILCWTCHLLVLIYSNRYICFLLCDIYGGGRERWGGVALVLESCNISLTNHRWRNWWGFFTPLVMGLTSFWVANCFLGDFLPIQPVFEFGEVGRKFDIPIIEPWQATGETTLFSNFATAQVCSNTGLSPRIHDFYYFYTSAIKSTSIHIILSYFCSMVVKLEDKYFKTCIKITLKIKIEIPNYSLIIISYKIKDKIVNCTVSSYFNLKRIHTVIPCVFYFLLMHMITLYN